MFVKTDWISFTAGLHNSESSKGQMISINLPRAAKIIFHFRVQISLYISTEEIVKRQLFIRGRAFATFLEFEKAFAGCKKSFRRLHAAQFTALLYT